MNVEELADHWEQEADTCIGYAEKTRSLDAYVRENARAAVLRQCAMQLRLVTRPPLIVQFEGPLTSDNLTGFRDRIREALKRGPTAGEDAGHG